MITSPVDGRSTVLKGAELWSTFCDHKDVNWQFARFGVSDKLEPIGEERLHHLLFLLAAGVGAEHLQLRVDGGIGLGLDIEPL